MGAIKMSFKADPHGATVDGKTISDWTKEWWKWIVDGPREPLNQSDDTTGLLAYTHNTQPIFFLAGNDPFSVNGNNATRTIFVAHGRPILVPLLNAIDIEGPGIPQTATPPVTGTTALQELAQNLLDAQFATIEPSTLTLTIDGQSIAVADLQSHLEKTDFFSVGTIEPGSLLTSKNIGVTAGAIGSVSKASGYFVMLEDLSRGVHTISFGGSTTSGPIQTTDHLIIV
jgi:hypothetical protein